MDNGRIMKELKELQDGVKKVSVAPKNKIAKLEVNQKIKISNFCSQKLIKDLNQGINHF